jgi:hypothetical protein
MATRMQQRRGTAAQWTAANPILAAGEIGFETDNNRFKIGNGATAWTALDYFANSAALTSLLDGAPDALNTLNELAASLNDDPTFFSTVAANLESHRTATGVHGIADTTLLTTVTQVNTAISEHNSDTTSVHGIADTSQLATTSATASAISDAVGTHASDTTSVHGIPDTSLLATQEFVTDSITTATVNQALLAGTGIDWNAEESRFDIDSTVATKTYADDAVVSHDETTLSVHGIADTSLLATQDFVADAITNSTDNYPDLAGTGLDWNAVTLAFDIDSTVSTKTYADDAVTTAVAALTKSSVGLANVDNTSDVNKPVSTATQTALDLKAPKADPTFTGTVSGVTKSHVGLGNVDNTSDANKPVSTATQTALDAKASLAGAVFTGNVEVDGNLVVDGDFTVNGTNFNASATSITIEDNMLQLAHNQAGNTVDLGLVVAYNDGTYRHAGIVRDVSESKWKLFKNVAADPTTTVDFASGALDDLQLAALQVTTVTPSAGVVFSDGTQTKEGVQSRTPIIQKTASYTLSALTERDSMIEMGSASPLTLTVPTNATVAWPVGTSIDILQTGAGQVTIAPAAGVTVNGTPGLKLRTTWSGVTLFKRATDTWVVYGDLTA